MLALRCLAMACVAVQAVQPDPPVFRGRVDLLEIQATVLDAAGRPIPDLRAEDFAVTLDGKPRSVRVVRFFGRAAETRAARSAGSPSAGSAVSNMDPEPGRVLIFAAHRDSMRAGSGGLVLKTAAKLIEQLTPRDVSGFVTLPTGAMTIGRDHQAVRRDLERAVGTQSPPQRWRYYVELRDALAFERRDLIGMRHVLERECRREIDQCSQEIADQAREMLAIVRTQTSETLRALRQVIHSVSHIRAPKLILLLSGGLWVEQESLALFSAVGADAAAARAVVHSIQVDQVLFDAEDRGAGPTPFAAAERQDGLRQVAASTGGLFHQAIGTAEGVFANIATEITSFYELGIGLEPDDIRAKPRTLHIAVTRAGASVRSRRDIVLQPRAAEKGDRIVALLKQPIDVPELPLELDAYATRGGESGTLKMLVSARIGAAAPPTGVEWAFVVFRGAEQVAYARDRASDPRHVLTAAQLPPGIYRMRFAALADDGREGVVDSEIVAGLRQYGEVHSSDLIVGSLADGGFVPHSSFAPGETARALVELYAAAPESFESAAVGWELYRAREARVLFAQRSELARTGAPGRRVCELALPALDAPGDYLLSAVVYRAGRPIGKVSRSLIVRQPAGRR